MRFVLAGIAALLLLPLGAAAQSTNRYAVSLQGTIIDRVSYVSTESGEECVVRREGTGLRRLTLRSARPTAISVAGTAGRLAYAPARVEGVRVAGTTGVGSFTETRTCRGAPLVKRAGDCRGTPIQPVTVRAAFRRPARNVIRFRVRRAPGPFTACGLATAFRGAWLDRVPGRIDERALLNGVSPVRARGRQPSPLRLSQSEPLVETTRSSIVNWTLTFRRIDE